jgi:transforming growth factor-beta-induced protein
MAMNAANNMNDLNESRRTSIRSKGTHMIAQLETRSREEGRDAVIDRLPRQEPGIDTARIEHAVREILLAIGEDPDRDGLTETPKRVARAYREIFAGLEQDPAAYLERVFDQESRGVVVVRRINFFSVCEHHLLPFYGQAHIAYLPSNGRVVGLSKLARTVEVYARRPQVQERLTGQIADAIMSHLNPAGVCVLLEASHLCMAMRGVKKDESTTTTFAARGIFETDAAARAEVLTLISRDGSSSGRSGASGVGQRFDTISPINTGETKMNRKGRIWTAVVAVIAAAAVTASVWAQSGEKAKGPADAAVKDIVDTAVAGKFDTLVTAVKAAALVETLKGEGPFTVFAPTNEAFAKLPKGTLEALLKDPSKLRTILKYHVVSGKVSSGQVVKLTSVKTLLGQTVKIDATKGVKVNDATVTDVDIACKNGVIHVIDTVLLPQDDIVDVATKAGSFKTLLKALEAAGLVDTLRGEGPFTVFAPNDEAFAKLPPGTLDGLLKDPAKLKSVLTYHVASGELTADKVTKLQEIRTVNGKPAKIDTSAGVKIDNAKVLKTDIEAANGVIHVIDAVILPG